MFYFWAAMSAYSHRVAHMKTNNYSSNSTASNNAADSYYSATDIATEILVTEPEVVKGLRSIIRHPRSLARPMPQWRPPSTRLPALPATGARELTMAITRHRVGPRAQARVRGFGEQREPAYMVSVRLSDPSGMPLTPRVAEGWVRSLIDFSRADAIHEISSGTAATFVWLVDRDFEPIHSPTSLFEGHSAAA